MDEWDPPEWLRNFKCSWEEDRLIAETLPVAMEDYFSSIGKDDWQSILDQIRWQEDHCTLTDTGVSFITKDKGGKDEDYMAFCAGPEEEYDVESRYVHEFLKRALEQRKDEVEGQKDFIDFVNSCQKGEAQSKGTFTSIEAKKESPEELFEKLQIKDDEIDWLKDETAMQPKGIRYFLGRFYPADRYINDLYTDDKGNLESDHNDSIDVVREHWVQKVTQVEWMHESGTTIASVSEASLTRCSVLTRYGSTGGRKLRPLKRRKMSPITFNTAVHGSNIIIENEGMTARSVDSSGDGICFSQRKVRVEEKIHLKIIGSRRFKGSMRIGFTSKKPGSSKELLSHSYPISRDGLWIKQLPDLFGKHGNIVTYSVDATGTVQVSINGREKLLFFDKVDVKSDLWAVVDLYGSTVAVQLEDDESATDHAAICERDVVKLKDVQMETLRFLQDEHGGWISDIEKGIGKVGVVTEINDNNDAFVYFPDLERMWLLNPGTLEKVDDDLDVILEGDFVKVAADTSRVKSLQEQQVIFDKDVDETVGMVGRVQTVEPPFGAITVRIGGKDFSFNPKAVEKIAIENKGNCQGLHRWKKGFSTVCTKCLECTADGDKCSMKGKPLRPAGSPCGCVQIVGGCTDCGWCKKCAGERSGTGGDDFKQLLKKLISKELTGKSFDHDLREGDDVKVEIDADTFRGLQEGEADWDENMIKVIGVPGKVTGLLGKKVQVDFQTGARLTVVPRCLTKTSTEPKQGDLVKVTSDEKHLKKVQEGHGGYNEDMEPCLGKTGIVKRVRRHQVQVEVTGRKWWFNPVALTPRPSESATKEKASIHIGKEDYVKVVVDGNTFQVNQLGHGGYTDRMKEVMERTGVVHDIDADGDVIVYYPDGTKWCINPMSLAKVSHEEHGPVDMSHHVEVGDWVKVEADKGLIKRIQEGTVPWNDRYYDAAGNIGQVKDIIYWHKIVRVSIKNAVYPLNPVLIRKATSADIEETLNLPTAQSTHLARGDLVKIGVDLDQLKELQDGHGGYVGAMENVTGLVGSVSFIDNIGDIFVRFSSRRFRFNPAVLSKVHPTDEALFNVGDFVRIEEDKSRFISSQSHGECGGYNKDMLSTCGQIGRIQSIINDKKIRVKVHGRTWIFNPDLLTKLDSPGIGKSGWQTATICSPGKHDWSRGRCLVCTKCEECTQYGKLCPARGRPGRSPGSICGCGNGHAGCDDCGRCKTCADKEGGSDDDSDDDSGFGGMLKHLLGSAGLRRLLDPIEVTVGKSTDRPREDDTREERRAKFFAALREMNQVIEFMAKAKELGSIRQVYLSLAISIDNPSCEYNQGAERKEIGDHLANIDAASVFKEYVTFLTSKAIQEADTEQARECLGLLYNILMRLTDNSSEFCRAVGRSGLLEILVQELAKYNTEELQRQEDSLKIQLIAILDNIAKVPDVKDYFRDAGALNVLQPYLGNEVHQHIKLNALSCLSFIVETNELHLIKVSPALGDYIIALLNQAISSPEHKVVIDSYSKSAMELVATVSSFMCTDENKRIFVERGILDLLVTFVEVGNGKEKESAIACIQVLATNDAIRTMMKSNSSLVEGLRAQLNHDSWAVRNAVKKTLKLVS